MPLAEPMTRKDSQVARYPSLSHWGAFNAVVVDGRVRACEPFFRDTAPSAILASMPGMVHSPLRITRPAVRRDWLLRRENSQRRGRGSDDFVEVPWSQALTLVAEELAWARAERGPTSIFGGSYGWSSAGRLHHARTLTQRFLGSGGGYVGQTGNYSWGAAQFLLPHVIGSFAPVTGRVTDWRSIVSHTGLLIAFGGMPLRNTQVSSGGAGDHPTRGWLRKASAAGVKLVVISPTRADVPEGIDAEWIGIRPNTDTALMLGMIHVLLEDGLYDRAFTERHCEGFERFADYVRGATDGQAKTVHWASSICGVAASQIRELARRAAATRTLLTCAWSLQRAHHGEQPYWCSIALAAALGQIGLPGGGFAFGHASMNGVGTPRPAVPGPEMAAPANPARCSIPVARMADMLLHPGAEYEFNGEHATYPDIELVYWAGGNPFHHHQDLNRLERAWRKPRTIVVHESWWTPTARRADIVLPATTTLERNDLGGSSNDRFVLAMKQAIRAQGLSRNDFDIFAELAEAAGHAQAFTEGRNEMQWLRHIYERMLRAWAKAGIDGPGFESFWEAGFAELAEPESDYVLFESFRQDPAAHPLATPSGRIELYSERIAGFGYDDCPPHPCWIAPAEWLGAEHTSAFPLHLVTCQPEGKLHSQLDAGVVSLADKIEGRERVRLSPRDAAQRGLKGGDVVRVYNRRGSCLAATVVDDRVLPGVIIMATGAWFDPQDEELERHGNPNVLTLDLGTSRLAQGTSALSALVQIERWQGEVTPAVQAFRPPTITP